MQNRPAPQTWSFGAFVHEVVLDAGEHSSQPSRTLAPGAKNVSSIQQPGVQAAGLPSQTSPEGQLGLTPPAPVQAVVVQPGWQLWQGLFGSTALGETNPVPGMEQPETHCPPEHAWPHGPSMPSLGSAGRHAPTPTTSVHVDALALGVQISQSSFAMAPEG